MPLEFFVGWPLVRLSEEKQVLASVGMTKGRWVSDLGICYRVGEIWILLLPGGEPRQRGEEHHSGLANQQLRLFRGVSNLERTHAVAGVEQHDGD